MLHKTYSIYSDDLNDVRLFVETGKNHIACWCKKSNDDVLRAFEFFQCDDASMNDFEALINEAKQHSRLLSMPVTSTNIFWNTDEVLCIPKEKNDAAFLKQNFELLKGNIPDATIFSNETEHCTIAWRIENNKQQNVAEHFNGAAFTHQFTALLPSLEHNAGDVIYLFLYPYYFTLCAFKQGKLHYLNTIKYNTPEDVLYFVLNVCKQYDIEKNVAVHCGGFIDEQSKLYQTLYQYLEGFQLLKANEAHFASDEFKEYALHYFTPYINYVV